MTDVFLPAVLPWVKQWLTPVWMMSVGIAAGMAILALAWGIVALINRRWSAEIREALGEGVLLPAQALGIGFAVFAVLGAYVADDPRGVALSFSRITAVGNQRVSFTLPASEERAKDAFAPIPFETLKVSFRRDEIRRIDFLADQNVEIRTVPPDAEQAKTGGVKLDITRAKRPCGSRRRTA